MQNLRKSMRGQVIVELMVAVSILVIGLLGVFAVLAQSLSLHRVAANQYTASNLAAEGIEIAKNILDSNVIQDKAWNDQLQSGNYGLQFDTCSDPTSCSSDLVGAKNRYDERLRYSSGMYGYGLGEETPFVREVMVVNTPDAVTVRSIVTWVDRGGLDFMVEVEDVFLNWRRGL